MKTTKITPSEYAEMRGITIQAVTKAIRKKHYLPGVEKVEKYGRFYLLTIKN